MKENILYWILAILILLYLIYQKGKSVDVSGANNTGDSDQAQGNSSARSMVGVAPKDICIPPNFPAIQYSGVDCAGSYINEAKVLGLGDSGCGVLLIQQRLNSIENTNILSPTGQFDCNTLNKLRNVKGIDRISPDQFQPDEEIGFSELTPTKQHNNNSYMDIDTYPI